jgi:predicted cobalt transporter CbtA
MRRKRPTDWMIAAGVIAAVGIGLLALNPAAFPMVMLIIIMAGLPTLYRLRHRGVKPPGDRPDTRIGRQESVRA